MVVQPGGQRLEIQTVGIKGILCQIALQPEGIKKLFNQAVIVLMLCHTGSRNEVNSPAIMPYRRAK